MWKTTPNISDPLPEKMPAPKHLDKNWTSLQILSLNLTLVLPRGVVTTPLTVCLRPHKNAKESDPGHVGHLYYILCGHFDEKKNTGGTP